MVTMLLAGLLMTGLTLLYLTAQRNWLEASSKLMLQQGASILLDGIAAPVRSAHSCRIDVADSTSLQLERCDAGHSQASHEWFAKIYWDASDSLVHLAKGVPLPPSGPALSNVRVTRLRFGWSSGQPNVLQVVSLRARDPYGQTIELSDKVIMQNYVN